MADRADLSIYQGDDFAAFVSVFDADGAPADITGYAATAQIRRDAADRSGAVVAALGVTITDPVTGALSLALGHDETAALRGKYVWDLQVIAPGDIRTTLLAGTVTIQSEVTREAAA